MRATTQLILSLAIATMPVAASAVPTDISTAVAASGRSEDNRKLDESRKPAEVLEFLGLRKGMHAIDLFGGNLYWAEIMAPYVGPRGRVTVWEPKQFHNADSKKAFDAFKAKNRNAGIIVQPFEAPKLPRNTYDFMMINLNYHDLYWESAKFGIPRMDPAVILKEIHGAMKPGGIVGVIDHVANPGGDTREVVEKLHRIDPEVIKADFQRAGFELVGIRNMLRNPADDHSLLVFDKTIRGKTDRVVYRFRKPR